MMKNVYLYILVMALVTYFIRMTPFVLFRKKIKSRFFRSMLCYLPYAVISAMILPSIFYSADGIIPAVAGFAVAVLLALFERSLIIVALGACASAFAADMICTYLIK